MGTHDRNPFETPLQRAEAAISRAVSQVDIAKSSFFYVGSQVATREAELKSRIVTLERKVMGLLWLIRALLLLTVGSATTAYFWGDDGLMSLGVYALPSALSIILVDGIVTGRRLADKLST